MNTFFISDIDKQNLNSSLYSNFFNFSKFLRIQSDTKQNIKSNQSLINFFKDFAINNDTDKNEIDKILLTINNNIEKHKQILNDNLQPLNLFYSLKNKDLSQTYNIKIYRLYIDFLINRQNKYNTTYLRFIVSDSEFIDNRQTTNKTDIVLLIKKIYYTDRYKTDKRINHKEFKKFIKYGIVSKNIENRINHYYTYNLNKVSQSKKNKGLLKHRKQKYFIDDTENKTYKTDTIYLKDYGINIRIKKGFDYVSNDYQNKQIDNKIKTDKQFILYQSDTLTI